MINRTIRELHEALLNKQITCLELTKQCINKLANTKKYNACIFDNQKKALELAKQIDEKNEIKKEDYLFGIPFSLKDNISTKGIVTTGGSLFLKNYVPPFNAFVAELLCNQNAVLLAKANLDEFGLGGTGTFSAFGDVINPLDKTLITGGSSSGSAVMVQQGVVPFSLGTDTGDSIRKPANYLGIVGFKPSYGLISRYGVFPYSPSLDHVGMLTNDVTDVAILMDYLAKVDYRDFTSISNDRSYYNNLKPNKNYKVAILKNLDKYMTPAVKKEFDKTIKILKKEGFKFTEIEFNEKLLQAIDPLYKIISYAEAASCYANLTGIPFGLKAEGKTYLDVAHESRTMYFGKQLKRRFIIGAYATSTENFERLFNEAKRIRTLVNQESTKIYQKYDFIMMPGASNIAPKVSDVKVNKATLNICDDALQMANFGGFPSITIPMATISKQPIGLNISSSYKNDLEVLNCALAIEQILKLEGTNNG